MQDQRLRLSEAAQQAHPRALEYLLPVTVDDDGARADIQPERIRAVGGDVVIERVDALAHDDLVLAETHGPADRAGLHARDEMVARQVDLLAAKL